MAAFIIIIIIMAATSAGAVPPEYLEIVQGEDSDDELVDDFESDDNNGIDDDEPEPGNNSDFAQYKWLDQWMATWHSRVPTGQPLDKVFRLLFGGEQNCPKTNNFVKDNPLGKISRISPVFNFAIAQKTRKSRN